MHDLKQFEADLKSFHEYCKENRIDDADIKRICRPLTRTIIKTKLLTFSRRFTLLFVAIVFFYVLFRSENVSWHLAALGRITLIKFLPFYDWQPWKNEKCLVSYTKTTSSETKNDCTFCEAIQKIDVEDDLNAEHVKHVYIDLNVPVVLIDDADYDSDLIETIIDDVSISNSYPCKMSSNLKTKEDDTVGDVLRRTKMFDSFFVHFQNCDFDVVKAFRKHVPRPRYLYADFGPVQYSWLLTSRNYNVTRFKRLKLNDRLTVFRQMRGANVLKLFPIVDCRDDCPVLEIELSAGESVVFTSMWDVEYKPELDTENVAVILETH